jgi:hypothetical protein
MTDDETMTYGSASTADGRNADRYAATAPPVWPVEKWCA